MDVKRLNVNWKGHSSELCSELYRMREQNFYTDATIFCAGEFYPVHKSILAASSNYFEEIFQQTQELHPVVHPVITLTDIAQSTLEVLLRFMYIGEVDVKEEDITPVLDTAKTLSIKGLCSGNLREVCLASRSDTAVSKQKTGSTDAIATNTENQLLEKKRKFDKVITKECSKKQKISPDDEGPLCHDKATTGSQEVIDDDVAGRKETSVPCVGADMAEYSIAELMSLKEDEAPVFVDINDTKAIFDNPVTAKNSENDVKTTEEDFSISDNDTLLIKEEAIEEENFEELLEEEDPFADKAESLESTSSERLTRRVSPDAESDDEDTIPKKDLPSDENPGGLWNDLKNYKLPPFSPVIKTILQTKKSPRDYLPGTSNRRAVIRALTDDLVKRHIVTLSREGYTNLVNALFSEYPHIGDPKCWRMSIRTKMKNIRMPLGIQSVQLLKEKFGCQGTGGRKSIADAVDEEREACKKTHTLKIVVEGPEDDEMTTLSHINALKAELRKGLPDLAMIARKMERTFAFRWKKINDPSMSVEDILSDFPALRERNFLAGEAERHGILKPHWSTYLKFQSSLLELMKYAKGRCKNYKKHYSKYEEDLDNTLDEDQRIDCSLRFVVQLLPSLFKENEDYLLVHSEEDIKSPAPVLTFQGGEFQLVVSGISVFSRKTSNFKNAFEALFQCYWVFSLEYPKPIAKTLLFLESYLFKHICTSKLPAPLRTWAKKIGVGE